MSIEPGVRLGRYEIRSKIGEGGMGEVYRARDEKLSRDVAIKVLPESLASDKDRLLRFEKEAEATGTLNHPNILAVYDVGTRDGSPYIVSELLEGEELRVQLNGNPLPPRKAIDYAQQIAHGLAAAHDKGITHRDLKPENLFVTTDGRIKILDFGLAKLKPQHSDVISSEIATIKQITDPGTVMGTVGYMSPEQVRGNNADHRSDIFSFGSILHELLSGRRAFQRDTTAETMTAILKEDPPELSGTDNRIPLPLERIVTRCLQKKPEQRFQSTHDLAFALEALSTVSSERLETAGTSVSSPATSRLFQNVRLAWMAAAFLLVVLLISLTLLIAIYRRGPSASSPIVRYEVQSPGNSVVNLVRWPAIALSPDGSTLAFVASSDGINRLYIRKRNETDTRPLPGTEGAAEPVFSPNGKWIAFMSDFAIKKVSLDGLVSTVVNVGDARGISWLNDDTLVYSPEPVSGVFRISSNGDDPRQISKLDEAKKERTHRWPQALPNGKAVIFTVGTLDSPDSYERSNIEAVILATGERRVVMQNASMARYVPTGHLVFARGGGLYATRFDIDTLTAQGNAEQVLQGVAGDVTTGAADFAIAGDGTLAFVAGETGANGRKLFWSDRTGNVQPINIPAAQYNDTRISPDGSRVALLVGSSGTGDVWVYDLTRTTATRLTFNAVNASPIWSADGKTIYYSEIEPTGIRSMVYRKAADGSREAEKVSSLENTAYIKSLKGDSAAILDYQMNINSGDVVELALQPNAQIARLINSRFNEYAAALSPDGHWLAYQSNESGRPEIYVRDMSEAGGRTPVSTDGGEEPRWAHDGRELFYRKQTSFMSVTCETSPGFHASAPKELFKGVFDLRSNSGVTYDVDPKNDRFLMIRPAQETTAATQVQVVLNWFDELRRVVPTK